MCPFSFDALRDGGGRSTGYSFVRTTIENQRSWIHMPYCEGFPIVWGGVDHNDNSPRCDVQDDDESLRRYREVAADLLTESSAWVAVHDMLRVCYSYTTALSRRM